MLIQLWLATTWFLYSGPNNDINEIANTGNSHCQPSCMMADSIFNNMKNETDQSLVPVKCSFLSYLFEHCWDSECRPSVDKNMKETIEFYRNNCGSISCFPILSPSDLALSLEKQFNKQQERNKQKEKQHHQQQQTDRKFGKVNNDLNKPTAHMSLEKARTLCSGKFESLLRVLMNPSCQHVSHNNLHQIPHGHEVRSIKLTEFKQCVEQISGHSCKRATSEFLDTFAQHILEHQAC